MPAAAPDGLTTRMQCLDRAAAPMLSSDPAIRECADLFAAVEVTLGCAVHQPPAAHDGAARLRLGVLACLQALDRLRTALTTERGRCHQLEREVDRLHTALAQTRAELAGTQAGERRARHLARHDDLTALPNRGYFHERLAAALACAAAPDHALAVLYLDLDGFKAVNDAHGHDAGDELLRIVAARLTRAVRAQDMASRLGGDEFACLLAGVPTREQLAHLARKVFDAVSAPMKVGRLSLMLRPSIGIATCPAQGATAQALLRQADAAMYHAKRRRTGYAFFDEAPAPSVERQLRAHPARTHRSIHCGDSGALS